MKLGIAMNFNHTSPEDWAQKHLSAGLTSVVFPLNYTAPVSKIDAYVSVCKSFGLTIAEVGTWNNLMASDPKEKQANFEFCQKQLELADYIGSACCVNISGAKGPVWDGGYPENYSEKTYAEIVETAQKLIDSVSPRNTFFTLEPMPWMYPDSPESYLQLIKDIDRKAFGAHLDMVNMINNPQKYLFNEKFTNDTISLLGPYIKSCHIKDVLLETRLTLSLTEVPCGQGGFHLKNYIEQINNLNPDLPVIIEHLSKEEEYIAAIDYITKLTDTTDC